jgi:hypothetical protein
VKAALDRYDLAAAGDPERELERILVGFGARVAEEGGVSGPANREAPRPRATSSGTALLWNSSDRACVSSAACQRGCE